MIITDKTIVGGLKDFSKLFSSKPWAIELMKTELGYTTSRRHITVSDENKAVQWFKGVNQSILFLTKEGKTIHFKWRNYYTK